MNHVPHRLAGLCALLLTMMPTLAQGPTLPALATQLPTPSIATLDDQPRLNQPTFAQLGQREDVTLRAGQRYHSVSFAVRTDEVITRLALRLNFTHSPISPQETSYLNVRLNGEIAGRITVPADASQRVFSQDVLLDPRLVIDYNQLTIELAGAVDCTESGSDQDSPPATTDANAWAQISATSTLNLAMAPLPVANDLALLPAPFFDKRDSRPLELSLVMAPRPGNDTLQAAGSVASWLGALASYRGLRLESRDSLPPSGHAIVLATQRERPTGVDLPTTAGASISVVNNPSNPRYKVLYVLGRDEQELRRAVDALVLNQISAQGSSVLISRDTPVARRQPHDAPRWLPTHRAVRFDEIIPPTALEVQGQHPGPIRLDMRLPPDLFLWRSRGIPVDVRYYYSEQARGTPSMLNVQFNGEPVRDYAIAEADSRKWLDRMEQHFWGSDRSRRARFRLTAEQLGTQSYANLTFAFSHGNRDDRVTDCPSEATTRSTIDGESTIDFSGVSHYLPLPDLAAFANAGFPFTRVADLGETAVVMPDVAGSHEIAAYLGLMGRMGESTGYPARLVTVVRPRGLQSVADRELIVIGTAANQPLLRDWSRHLPFTVGATTAPPPAPEWWRWLSNFWQRDRHEPHGTLNFATTGADAALVGFESPLTPGRSVVALIGSRSEALTHAATVLTDPKHIADVRGHVAVIKPSAKIVSYLADPTYTTGELPWLEWLRWQMSSRPVLLWGVLLGSIFVLSSVIYTLLRRLAMRRHAGAAA